MRKTSANTDPRATRALTLVRQLARMTTPTDDAASEEEADDIMSDLDDETLCEDASALYELIRQARAIETSAP